MCVVVGCLFFFVAAKAQLPEYHLQIFDYPTGIRSDAITSMGKDQKGMLWILYRSQVQSFDGKEVQNFRPSPRVNSMLCDQKGHIWVCADKEVFLFSEKTGTFNPVAIEGGEKGLKIGPVTELPDGDIWLLTNRGFFRFNAATQRFSMIDDLPQPVSELETDVCVLYNNVLFVHNNAFIYRYHFKTGKTDSLAGGRVYGIYPVSEDSALVSTRYATAQWYQFSTQKITTATLGNGISGSFSLRSMAAISPSRFLVAASDGIFEYDARKKQFLKQNFFLNGRKVATNEYASFIFYDEAEGHVWVATTDGIARFAFRNQPMGLIKIRQMNDEISANINDVRKIIQDEKGDLWIATGYGFACWQKKESKWTLFPPAKNDDSRLSHESIRGMVYDGRYLILGPTNKGLWLFDVKTQEYRRPKYDSPETRRISERDFVNDMITLLNGDHLIVARDAVYVLDGKTYRLRRLNDPAIRNSSASFCAQGMDGIVWIATTTGVYCFDASLNYLMEVPEDFKSNVITYGFSGFMMKDNRLLFSSTKGLYILRYNNGHVTSKKLTTVFDNIGLYTVYQDRNGIIWASSENGIYRFDPKTSKLNLFDRSDNIQGYGFNSNSWFRDRDGILYFGGLNGINYWQPETFSAPYQSFEAYISKVRFGDKDYSMYAFDTLGPVNYSDRSMGVAFAAVYFNNPEKVRYRYKLNGLDTEWKEIGNGNIVRFSSLAPGRYVLEMEASLNQVDWKKANNTLAFRILNPFWMTWWFIALCIAVAAGIVIRMILNHRRKINNHKEELAAAQAINYFSSSIYETNDIGAILRDIVKNAISRLHFEDCIIYTIDKMQHVLRQKAAHRSGVAESQPVEITTHRGVAAAVAAEGRAKIVYDAAKDARAKDVDNTCLSEIAVPIITDDKVWGVIYCGHSKKGFFTQKHLSILTTIASLCANKIIKTKADREKARAESIIMDTRQKMADAEMQALRAQMNPHFIFNCLNSINRYIVKSDQATASLYLTRFARLIRLILDNSNSKSITLASELEALRLYIEMESIRFEKKFTCNISFTEEVYPESIYVPPLIIQPYVENAIWHGLLHKTTEGTLSVHISRKGSDMLQCIIEDNGVGRTKARELKSKTASSRKSLGMQLTESRLVLLSRQAGLDASVDIEDMTNELGEALGTKVILNIPVDET